MHTRVSVRSPIKRKHNRTSCRSPKKIAIYKVLTKTLAGDEVPVPTDTPTEFFKLPKPIKVNTTWEWMPLEYNNWEEALSIYENNQQYYLQEINKGVKIDIKELEDWFNAISEPKSDDWQYKQEFKKKNGYSIYFDTDLLPYL